MYLCRNLCITFDTVLALGIKIHIVKGLSKTYK